MAEIVRIREAANKSAVRLGYSLGLKKEQLEVVVAFMTGKDVFAVLLSRVRIVYACVRCSDATRRSYVIENVTA
jgi:hypothetical protein